MKIISSLALIAAIGTTPLSATTVSDPVGDFLSTYTGPANSALDIVSSTATYTTSGVFLSSTFDAASAAPGSYFIWGVDRGNGTPRLISSGPPAVGPPSILLDAVVRFGADGSGFVLAFPPIGAPVGTPLAAGSVTVAGNSISSFVPFSLLPSTGFGIGQYTYINWSRSALGSQANIADLAPDDRVFTASFVPEADTWALLTVGFGVVGAATRRRRREVLAG